MTFQEQILQGIPKELPESKSIDFKLNPAPSRKQILSLDEKRLAIKNALRYFPKKWHKELAYDFIKELDTYGRIYMIRFKPNYSIYARSIDEYPAKISEAAAIMLMIQNNLNEEIAQHPQELITYGGNGAVFQNWAQYLLTMKYLAEMNNNQTLHLYSGHPMGLFPSSKKSPRVVITNGMMIPNYSKPDDWERFNALGVTQYGQMTAGSFMYIGPQGIVHGTTITLMNAFRKVLKKGESVKGKIFLTSGLGGMSGAQPKAGNIVGCITITAEVNYSAAKKRHDQGWVDKLVFEISELVKLVKEAQLEKKIISFAYIGNIVDVWEAFLKEKIHVTIGSDQTSLHNPWSGGYYPVDLNYDQANILLKDNPGLFKQKVQESLKKHSMAIKMHVKRGTYFFDYGNAFLLEASRAGADVMNDKKTEFRYPSYVQDILGPICFDNGFGPFRWVCASGNEEDLKKTDEIAKTILTKIKEKAPSEIQGQLDDNIKWIEDAQKHKLVVGSKARILYADSEGRIEIARAFNLAISKKEIGPVILGRDHHDVSGTDSPYRETSNIYDGSKFTADMAIHNVIGDSFRGATWVSIHNGGGVGWGEVINGGFGMLLDGTKKSEKKLEKMLFFDVNNGIARRSWARNKPAIRAIKHEMKRTEELKVLIPEHVDDSILDSLYK
ncbi:MAG: urocanate hydratase [Cryomorphaceae bacterium]|jgi:urocanate hydratase|nr:urocanate hydratase [Cryomorphaceae bacterium]MBT4221902.1 urocanate hydratase [Cryomorphaceae bacterium]MBT4517201.1 urocanate hydratase [Cryomorphaceae bacterium]MBT6318138.1 urocanate hydratase [Cryomorphaceae bacterium]|tara:strand:+ start:1795 stop:3795 length:2001 start_codon:yes stop_codon:yes gene_type:complete